MIMGAENRDAYARYKNDRPDISEDDFYLVPNSYFEENTSSCSSDINLPRIPLSAIMNPEIWAKKIQEMKDKIQKIAQQ